MIFKFPISEKPEKSLEILKKTISKINAVISGVFCANTDTPELTRNCRKSTFFPRFSPFFGSKSQISVISRSHFSNPSAIVLVVVENVNQNQIDQRHVEYEVEKLGVPVNNILRRNLTECYEQLSVDDKDDLIIGGKQVAIVYFRAGYSPDHYPSEKGKN